MEAVAKKILIISLGFSNLAVLGMVFHSYFNNHQSLKLFSVAENRSDLKEKIHKECKKELAELLNGKRVSFICSVNLDQKHRGASYTLSTKFKVKKEGNKIKIIEKKGAIRDSTQHATEADFCNECLEDRELEDSATKDITELMKEVIEVADEMFDKAQESVENAYEKYNEKDREKRIARIKERDCKGSWNDGTEKFEEFNVEEKLDCRMKQVSRLSPLDVEKFYHNKLKKELWLAALSDDDYALDGLMDEFNDPYRYALSVRSSTGLLKNYLNWKNDFEVLESVEDQIAFVNQIKGHINHTADFMGKERSQQDLYYLNKGFDGVLARLNQATQALPRSSSVPGLPAPGSASVPGPAPAPTPVAPSPAIDYEAVRRQVKDL